jgi:hypothetical protein
MSARNGHKAKFNLKKKAKLQRRMRTRALRQSLAHHGIEPGLPIEAAVIAGKV